MEEALVVALPLFLCGELRLGLRQLYCLYFVLQDVLFVVEGGNFLLGTPCVAAYLLLLGGNRNLKCSAG